jgi:predicted subunit of tRNA(5-methylaminomethyl-2-thiouridylate) methyltransferase
MFQKKEAVLLFSGGRDSSLAAVRLIEMGYEIHLLTFDNGAIEDIARSNLRLAEFNDEIKKNIITRKIINCKELFKKIALFGVEKDIKSFKTNLICMGCKMAMHTISVNYCLKNDIKVIADGYTYYQREWPEQMPKAIEEIRNFHSKYGIEYINPVYDIKSKENAKERLALNELSVDSLEGKCVFGGTFSTPIETDVVEYIKAKIDICENYLSIKQPISHNEKYEEAIAVSFCIMDQFMRAKGAKIYKKNLHTPILEWAINNNIAIIPLPCPEYSFEGIDRRAAGIEKYDIPKLSKALQRAGK